MRGLGGGGVMLGEGRKDIAMPLGEGELGFNYPQV